MLVGLINSCRRIEYSQELFDLEMLILIFWIVNTNV